MAEPILEKVDPGTRRTAYKVRVGKKLIGYVWSKVGFSYWGDQGWNRGIRIRDYHPIEWEYGKEIDYNGHSACSRMSAVQRLVGEHGSKK